MGTEPSRRLLFGLALLAGCVAQRQPRITPRTVVGTSSQIEDLVRLALTLDAAGDRAADTLYAADALVVANARVRLAAPRFAGIGYGGRVTVATATVTLEGRFAWVLMDYRWFNLQQNQAEAGRASFVCENRSSGWTIVHVHSSQLLPWDR
ncbi:MAG: nuclear transport factor 2 family protein [Gemmatimonadetes bacterium]|nr:nuclear transport factor 2 family protein [Gemmatimonadota bacterium]